MLESSHEPKTKADAVNACVLVVEDEDLVRDLAERVLSLHGYRIFAAHDGSHAVKLYEEHAKQIDLVLLDLTMPGMSGAEVFEALLRIGPVRVLLTSGYSQEDSAELMKSPHVVGFLPKPYRVDKLIEQVERALAPKN